VPYYLYHCSVLHLDTLASRLTSKIIYQVRVGLKRKFSQKSHDRGGGTVQYWCGIPIMVCQAREEARHHVPYNTEVAYWSAKSPVLNGTGTLWLGSLLSRDFRENFRLNPRSWTDWVECDWITGIVLKRTGILPWYYTRIRTIIPVSTFYLTYKLQRSLQSSTEIIQHFFPLFSIFVGYFCLHGSGSSFSRPNQCRSIRIWIHNHKISAFFFYVRFHRVQCH
jgi:hypothetical protein